MPDPKDKKRQAIYNGVHEIYNGVHNQYPGVHDQYQGVDTGKDPEIAPGMYDFLEKDASKEEVKKGDYTMVTTLSYDETH